MRNLMRDTTRHPTRSVAACNGMVKLNERAESTLTFGAKLMDPSANVAFQALFSQELKVAGGNLEVFSYSLQCVFEAFKTHVSLRS